MNRNTALLTAGAALAIAPLAAAEPYNPDLVAASARWVVHLDVEAVVRSELGSFILDNRKALDLDIDDIEQELGIDPTRDILGLTAYGEGDPEEMGATIVATTTGAIDGLLERAMAAAEDFHQLGAEGETRYYGWSDGDESWFLAMRPGPRVATRVVVISPIKDLMAHGLAVASGQAPSVRRAGAEGMDIRPGDGSFVFALATVLPDMLDADAASFVVRHAKHVLIDIGESQGNFMADLALTAATEQDARNVASVFQGLIALGNIAATAEPELQAIMPLLGGVRAVADGPHVLVHASVPVGDMLNTLREAAKHHGHEPGF